MLENAIGFITSCIYLYDKKLASGNLYFSEVDKSAKFENEVNKEALRSVWKFLNKNPYNNNSTLIDRVDIFEDKSGQYSGCIHFSPNYCDGSDNAFKELGLLNHFHKDGQCCVAMRKTEQVYKLIQIIEKKGILTEKARTEFSFIKSMIEKNSSCGLHEH